jgi:hypothetical protein
MNPKNMILKIALQLPLKLSAAVSDVTMAASLARLRNFISIKSSPISTVALR